MSQLVRISGKVQNYAWGKVGKSSIVAQLNEVNSTPEEDKPYAELWMGTHSNGPATMNDEGHLLSEWLSSNPSALGEPVKSHFQVDGGHLPYLFKILSIEKALSIQAHPDKTLAEKLFKESPKMYPDPNHKPELAMALNLMEALCGFRDITEIQSYLNSVPELRSAVGEEVSKKFLELKAESPIDDKKKQLKELFSGLMHQKNEVIEKQIDALVHRIQNNEEVKQSNDPVFKLVVRLNEQFPKDIGIFSAFLLNYVVLQPGEALYLAANEPHAYISGECAECMACSDNVVRAGLTPKAKDVPTLCSMLTYNFGQAEIQKGKKIDDHTRIYVPPIAEFLLHVTELNANEPCYHLNKTCSGSIILVYEGEGKLKAGGKEHEVKRGNMFFLSANETAEAVATQGKLVLLRCSCNL